MARKASGGTPATRALHEAGVAFTEHPYDHDPAAGSYGLEAAEALGVQPARVFKTLLVTDGSAYAVGLVPVDASLDLKAMAAALDTKRVQMAAVPDAERVTGSVAGGISPLGQRRRLRTVADTSLPQFDTVYVSGGRRGLDIELSPADLIALTDSRVHPIARH